MIIAIIFGILLIFGGIAYDEYRRSFFAKKDSPVVLDPVDVDYYIERHNDYLDFIAMKRQYLQSIKWKAKRRLVLFRDHYTCQLCGATTRLEIHHLSGYMQIPNESIDCLTTLCRDCHQHFHDIFPLPNNLNDYEQWNFEPSVLEFLK